MTTIREQMANDTLSFRRNIISGLGATRTLSEVESGSLILLDRAAGIVITLPTASTPGTFFEFMVTVTCTSNNYKIITGAGTELMVGSILNCDTDTADAVAIWKGMVGSSYISLILNADTTGGIKGSRIRLTCLNSTTWMAEGVTNGTGVVATPFSIT